MTNHANHSHPNTKAARAACRKAQSMTPAELLNIVETASEAPSLLGQVKAHALANYDRDGWDVVVEAMTDDEIVAVIGRTTSLRTAITRLGNHVRPVII
jgi:hypothetical protein